MSATVTEYRLSWEHPVNNHLVARVEATYGKDVWPRFDWEQLGDFERIEVKFLEGSDRMGQYQTLKRWAETREQPIRNVVLEKRKVPISDDGWTTVDG